MREYFKRTCPSLVDMTFMADGRKRKYTITLLTKMPNNLISILFRVFERKMTLQNLSEDHLDRPDHTPPTIICLYLLDPIPIREPECISKREQKFILLLR
jgi:hypothetical protein